VVIETAQDWIDSLGVTKPEVGERLHEVRQAIAAQAERIAHRRDDGEQVFPEVTIGDVLSGTVSAAQHDAIRQAGCAVVRATFEASEAEAWDAEIADYLERNRFAHRLYLKDPKAVAGSRIWPVYWSKPQVAARQHHRMVAVRQFLNSLWTHASHGTQWFDLANDIGYADRIRRREPGATSHGLRAHIDAPSAGGWRLLENQMVFAPLVLNGLDAYDPYDAAGRTAIDVESPVDCSVFRTFQGWTALSEMHPQDGVLQVVPIPAAVGYRVLHGLAGELGLLDDATPTPAPCRDFGDELVLQAKVSIPAVRPGDTVWWHGDLYHAVGDATNDTRWGNVMYIGSSPRCPRNDMYAATLLDRFDAGLSPVDFPLDDFEAGFDGRATRSDLNATGRSQFGL
jgi:Protein of unknown function (DUF1479)